ncbi:MAG: VWA domain-containing protein [Candidatus Coproplasma sp.]
MSSINFDNPWLLFIILPLAILLTVPFALAIRKDNLNGHNVASGVIHIIMAVLIGFSVAGTNIITTKTQTDVYVVADVSYSATNNLDTIDSYIVRLGKNLPANSRMGVICFGKDHKLVTRLGEKFRTVKNSGVDDSSTNIVDTLAYTGSLFRADVIKRIVLITDGRATDGSDGNALQRQVNALSERKIRVDAIFLDNNVSGKINEVQLSSADFTPSVSINKDCKASLKVQVSSTDGADIQPLIKIYLNEGEEPYKTLTPSLTDGSNTVKFDLYTKEEGVYNYRAVIESEGDNNAYNNELSFTQTVNGKTKVLLISNKYEDYTKLTQILDDDLDSVEIDAKIAMTSVPNTVEKLCQYDQIVLSDIDVTTLDNYELFVESLDTVVTQYGKSLLTFGDLGIQNHNGENNEAIKTLNSMLPVNYGKSDDASALYTLLIDTSRSMEELNKLERAKEAGKQIVSMLSENDELGVIEFNGETFTAHNIVKLNDTNRQSVIDAIDKLDVMQSTEMGSGLEAALKMMKGGNYREKRLMVISDGLNSPNASSGDPLQLVKELRSNSIYTSTLDVGRGQASDTTATNAKILLQNMATYGGGSYIDISTDSSFEEAINGELPQDVVSSIGEISYIKIHRPKDSVLKGIDGAEVTSSYVDNYVKSTVEANANQVLKVSYESSVSQSSGGTPIFIEAPLYAYWTDGGIRASFTSSLTGSWVSGISDDLLKQLIYNVFATTTPEEKTDYPFTFNVKKGTGMAEVSVSPSEYRTNSWTEIAITTPDGDIISGNMASTSSGFDYSFVTASEGRYQIDVAYKYKITYNVPVQNGSSTEYETVTETVEYCATRYLNVAYSDEYDSFVLYDASSLIKAVGAKGDVSKDGNLVLVNDKKDVGEYYTYLTMPLLIACAVLYAIDIGIRKLKLEDIKSLFKRGKK